MTRTFNRTVITQLCAVEVDTHTRQVRAHGRFVPLRTQGKVVDKTPDTTYKYRAVLASLNIHQVLPYGGGVQ